MPGILTARDTKLRLDSTLLVKESEEMSQVNVIRGMICHAAYMRVGRVIGAIYIHALHFLSLGLNRGVNKQ